ncbi:hypothetical protein FB45DRAFT_892576, partial [Roridomyces roridus]
PHPNAFINTAYHGMPSHNHLPMHTQTYNGPAASPASMGRYAFESSMRLEQPQMPQMPQMQPQMPQIPQYPFQQPSVSYPAPFYPKREQTQTQWPALKPFSSRFLPESPSPLGVQTNQFLASSLDAQTNQFSASSSLPQFPDYSTMATPDNTSVSDSATLDDDDDDEEEQEEECVSKDVILIHSYCPSTDCSQIHLSDEDLLKHLPVIRDKVESAATTEELFAPLLDERLVELDPFQAALGLVFMRRKGLEWEY